MRLSNSSIALLALPSTVLSVSLADFPPYLSGLPISCAIIYKQDIIGCSASDFSQSSTGCSAGCVRALQSFTPLVDTACANHNISGQNIIVAFLDNDGPASICQNADQILGSSTGTSISAPSTISSSTASSTSSAASTSPATSASGTPITTSTVPSTATVVPIPAFSTMSSLGMDTSSTSTTSSFRYSQTDLNDGSGGGSPFDTPGNLASGAQVVACSFVISLLAASTMLWAGFQ